ncbi:hypothetical protein [Pseudorhodoplanes sp.]|uniref:hypothetical protein n=1 Tax=Pseudorhodoplanes sp. TaxID=1934341 RepID=UPI003D10A390
MINRHGLARTIPQDIKLDVRRRSKFGCVICRGLICEYEHIDPPFSDASAHDPDRICLLCPTHHAEVTRGLLSKQQVLSAYRRVQENSNIRPPHYNLKLSGRSLDIEIGAALFDCTSVPTDLILIDGHSLLSVGFLQETISEVPVLSLSAQIFDQAGRPLLRIIDNELTFSDGLHDIRTQGSKISIFTTKGRYGAQIEIRRSNAIRLTRLNMSFGGCLLHLDEQFAVTLPLSGCRAVTLGMKRLQASGVKCAIEYIRPDPLPDQLGDISIVGGEGATICNSGLTLAKGAGQMLIPELAVWEHQAK